MTSLIKFAQDRGAQRMTTDLQTPTALVVEKKFRGWCFRFTRVRHWYDRRSMVKVEFKSKVDSKWKDYNTFGNVKQAFIAINRSLDMVTRNGDH